VPIVKYSKLTPKDRVFPFFMIKHSDQKELELAKKIETMIRPMSSEEFFTFFIEKTDIWERAWPSQKTFIKSVYPANEINHYEVSRALARGISKKNRLSDDNRNSNAKIAQR